MSNTEHLGFRAAPEDAQVESTVVRLDTATTTTARSEASGVEEDNSHISEYEDLNRQNLGDSANDSYFKSLVGRFQFGQDLGLPRSHAAVDLIATIICFAAVHLLYLGSLDLSAQRSGVLLSALALTPLSLYVGGMYDPKKLRSLSQELANLALCWMFIFAAIGLFAFLTKTAADVSRVWISSSMVLSLVSLACIRVLVSLGFIARGETQAKNIVLVGDTNGVQSVIRNLIDMTNSQIQIARVFDLNHHLDDSTIKNGQHAGLRTLKNLPKQLSAFVEKQRQSGAAIEQVWIAASDSQGYIVEELSAALFDSSVDVCIVPDDYAQRLLTGEVSRYGNSTVVNVSEVSLSPSANQFKRVCDLVVASMALLILGLPMLLVALLIKLESEGPVLFRQKRYGVDGREIEILKFRSMVVHSDSRVEQAKKNDARVTRIGKIIRRTSVDELPQLLNVLNGSMSLVGPRPHAVAHNEMWRKEIEGYMLRHKVRPGITGWAQVNGWRGETDTAYKMQQRVRYDLDYIKNWSPWLDIRILVLTVFVGFFHKNAY